MIISEQWLRDWVRVDLDSQGISDCLTNAGLEVDGVEAVGKPIENLVVGKVLEVEKHPDADRLNVTKVDIGSDVLDIVCGASNVRVGLMAAVATVGAKLPNGLKIKKAKVRGVPSVGMLCSASELGLEEESAGLIELDQDAEIGQRVDDYLQLNDCLIDIDLTPNRGDCLSVQGIARELKVLASGDYQPLDVSAVEPLLADTVSVDLQAPEHCPRYLSRVLKDIDPSAKTPLWMQERLRRSSVRPISPVVDVTNYVMLELGQPMHAFDLEKLSEGIVVRLSSEGEKIKLLDDSEATLDGETLVIADQRGPIAIAGVMGGADSAIGDETRSIVLEAAHFTRSSASGKARRYGLHTESSHRFERGVDPQLPTIAIERATELLLEICGGSAGPVHEKSNEKGLQTKPAVTIRLDRLISLLGMELEASEVGSILERIAESVQPEGESWIVTPPSYRFDIEREADLVEEVARVKGYDNIPTAMPRIAPRSVSASEAAIGPRQVRGAFVARDFREAITYSFIDRELQSLFSEEAPVELANPLADNMSVMRTSLLPGLVSALQFNFNRQHSRIRLFELGATYHKSDNGFVEQQKIAGVVTGARVPSQWGMDGSDKVDFYDLKADVSAVLALTGQENLITFSELEHIAMHPGQVASISKRVEGGQAQVLGHIGRLHPNLEKHFGVGQVFTFELDLDLSLSAELPSFTPVSRFPSVKRDLSVLVDENTRVSELLACIQKGVGKHLVKVELFDVYQGKGVPESQKSVSLSLLLQNREATMTDEESEGLMGVALNQLETEFDAKLRS
ncbi:phenylalanine--tRNA ligase subunit beta [Arenicella sp. 4NH20-0111]|uniref:phenylalanine--tRNA ligase subunit beta n=1 Tax=Arenicella sp. 4NH20-0111 TaxID=3127648 RepID=UPI00310A8580